MGEIRFVGTGETRGYPYLVCKKTLYWLESLVMSSCCYARGIQVLACRDFNEVIHEYTLLPLCSEVALIEGPPIQALAAWK